MSAQFLSSLADNALFVAAVQLLRGAQAPEWQQAALVPMFALFYVVLAPFVGAFADAGKLAEVRHKLEKLGLKTYTQVVEVEGSKRTRVRVGPFDNRAEADKAAARIRAAGLPAAILTL